MEIASALGTFSRSAASVQAGVRMLQDQATWDFRTMIREPSTGFKFYVFFLLVTCIIATARFVKIWRLARPFNIPQENAKIALDKLRLTVSSFLGWIVLTILAWGILTSFTLVKICYQLMDERIASRAAILFVIIDFATALNMALLVVLILYLARWYLLKRIERLLERTETR